MKGKKLFMATIVAFTISGLGFSEKNRKIKSFPPGHIHIAEPDCNKIREKHFCGCPY